MLKFCSAASLAVLAAVAATPVQADPLFAFLAPTQSQVAPQPQIDQAPAQLQQQQTEQAPTDETDDSALPPRLRRQVVDYPSTEAPGTIIVDTPHTYLYLILGQGKAMRYGIGVGREGFTWSGVKSIVRKTEWPDWYPPPEMIKRQPYLPRMVAGGPGNPLGARALYIGGTEYRIHGTNDPTTIGKHVSSGCIRLDNADIIDLFNRAKVGAKVIVLPQAPTREARITTRQASITRSSLY